MELHPDARLKIGTYFFAGPKTSSLNRPGFSHFDENWLCVYDNHSIPGADLQEMAAVARLPKPRQGLAFDRVILVKEPAVLMLDRNGPSLHQPSALRELS